MDLSSRVSFCEFMNRFESEQITTVRIDYTIHSLFSEILNFSEQVNCPVYKVVQNIILVD